MYQYSTPFYGWIFYDIYIPLVCPVISLWIIWVVSSSLLLWIMLLWTFLFKFLFECFRFSWGIQLRGNVMSYETLIRQMLIHFMAFHKSLRIYFFFFPLLRLDNLNGSILKFIKSFFCLLKSFIEPSFFICYYTFQLLNFCLNDFWHITDIFYLMTLFSDF